MRFEVTLPKCNGEIGYLVCFGSVSHIHVDDCRAAKINRYALYFGSGTFIIVHRSCMVLALLPGPGGCVVNGSLEQEKA